VAYIYQNLCLQHYGHKDDYNMVVLPPAIRLSTTQMENQGAYLLDDGRYIYLWCGPNIDPQLLEDLTGSPAFHLIDPLNVPALACCGLFLASHT